MFIPAGILNFSSVGVVSITSTSIAKLFDTIVIEKRVLGHSEGSPFPGMGRSPPSVEKERLVESTADLILSVAELLYPLGSFLVLT